MESGKDDFLLDRCGEFQLGDVQLIDFLKDLITKYNKIMDDRALTEPCVMDGGICTYAGCEYYNEGECEYKDD